MVTSIDEASVLGGEFAMNAAVTDRWSVYDGFSVLDTEIDENRHRPNTAGNGIPSTPDCTIGVGTEYRAPVTDEIEFADRLDGDTVGETAPAHASGRFPMGDARTPTDSFTPIAASCMVLGRVQRD
jgi:iron complex outermembrane receptor protein